MFIRSVSVFLCCLLPTLASAASYDWRFADPNSQLIAGSTMPPAGTAPVPSLLYHFFTPIGFVPSAFQPSLANATTVTYSLASTKEDILVLTGLFNFASLRSAGGTLGMVSQFYKQIEILAPAVPSGIVQIALINSNTLVVASGATVRASIDRYLGNPNQSLSNPLIQQASTYASGWDFFVLSSGLSVSKALAFLYVKGTQYLTTKAPGLSTALSVSTGFQLRGRLQNFRLELTINEPDTTSATAAANGIAAIPGSIKASGPAVPSLLSALAANTNVQAIGTQVSVVVNPILYSLSTVVSPPGAGIVSPSTTGIPFAPNSVVNLSAFPGVCYTTPVWSSNAPGGTVTMTSDQTVTANFQPAGIAPVAPGVTVAPQGIRLNKSTGRYQQSIVLNNSGSSLTNVTLVFDQLTPGAALFASDGTTTCAPTGSPYRNIASLPSALTTIVVEFTVANPSQAIQYTPRVLAGPGSR